MHAKGFLHKMLSSVMHKKRLQTLTLLVKTVLRSKRLSLSGLGREMDLPIQERSCIRRVDRFLGNKKLHKEWESICRVHALAVVGSKKNPDIIVDWSNIPNTTHNTLRAALVARGRAITLYEEVHIEKNLGNRAIQQKFLHALRRLLPEGCRPVIITDGGFHNEWFKEIVKLNWDYIGRIRGGSGKKCFYKERWITCAALLKKATRAAKYIGKVTLCRHNPMKSFLYLFKGKAKRRRAPVASGKSSHCSNVAYYKRMACEPWLLATSLAFGYGMPKKIVKKYSMRMQIEEGFRDLKSSRFGFGLENAYSKKPRRIEMLLLIAMLASFIAWLIGWIAEKKGLHYQFQSNTIKARRVLSLFFLGCQVVKRKIRITAPMFEAAVKEASSHAA